MKNIEYTQLFSSAYSFGGSSNVYVKEVLCLCFELAQTCRRGVMGCWGGGG